MPSGSASSAFDLRLDRGRLGQHGRMRLGVLGHLFDRGDDPIAVDLDAPDVVAVAPRLRHEDAADPLALGQQVVRMPADDHVDVVLQLRRDAAVVPGRELVVVAEVREQDDERRAARAEVTRCLFALSSTSRRPKPQSSRRCGRTDP